MRGARLNGRTSPPALGLERAGLSYGDHTLHGAGAAPGKEDRWPHRPVLAGRDGRSARGNRPADQAERDRCRRITVDNKLIERKMCRLKQGTSPELSGSLLSWRRNDLFRPSTAPIFKHVEQVILRHPLMPDALPCRKCALHSVDKHLDINRERVGNIVIRELPRVLAGQRTIQRYLSKPLPYYRYAPSISCSGHPKRASCSRD